MTNRVEYSGEPIYLDVKRCYMPVKIFSACPECGMEKERDARDQYFGHPSLNQPIDVAFCCYHEKYDEENDEWGNAGCDVEWDVYICLRTTIEVLKEEDLEDDDDEG